MHPDFKLPSKGTIKGRSSTLTAAFFTAITPVIEPADEEVDDALMVLGMSRGQCACVYCGGVMSEWDHFRPIVEGQQPTGFITEIANLVPSCGKCNQSKGGKHWKAWMLGAAPKSPKSRGIHDLDLKIERLDAYEKWRQPIQLNYPAIVGEELWAKHSQHWKSLLTAMAEAQTHAEKLRIAISTHLKAQRPNP